MPPNGDFSLLGTPLEALTSRRRSLGDVLAPPAATFSERNAQRTLNAERDSLRDVYRPPADRRAGGRGDILDDEDRMHAHAGRRGPVGEVVPVKTRVSVGHALLRAEGGAGGSQWGAERRRRYCLGEYFSAVERGGGGRGGIGWVGGGGDEGEESGVVKRRRGADDDDDCEMSLADDADVGAFGAVDGSLGAAASRMRAAMKGRQRSAGSDGVDAFVDGGMLERTFERGEIPPVPVEFADNPAHDWSTDHFRVLVPRHMYVSRLAARVADAEQKRLSSLQVLLEARRDAARAKADEDLRKAQASAGAALRSAFVPAGGGVQTAVEEVVGVKIGEIRRSCFRWEPDALVCKRLGIEMPDVPPDAECEAESHGKNGWSWVGERSGDNGFRITSVVSRGEQGVVDGSGAGEGPSSDALVIGKDDENDLDGGSANEVDSAAEEARQKLRVIVFGDGKVPTDEREASPDDSVENECEPVPARSRWVAADFF